MNNQIDGSALLEVLYRLPLQEERIQDADFIFFKVNYQQAYDYGMDSIKECIQSFANNPIFKDKGIGIVLGIDNITVTSNKEIVKHYLQENIKLYEEFYGEKFYEKSQ